MVDKPPVDPNKPPGSHSPQGPSHKPPPFTYKGGQIQARPMTFLGMHFDAKQAQKLWDILVQNICNAINKDKEKALKALKKLGKDNPDDS